MVAQIPKLEDSAGYLSPFPISVNPIGPSETRQWFVLGLSPRAPHTDLKPQALLRLAKWVRVLPLRTVSIPLCCSNDSENVHRYIAGISQ
jgi:hypothetical protein